MNKLRPFDAFRPVQEQHREQLPVGAYACRILNAQAEARPDGNQQLAVMVDIAEGPFTGFFRRDYDAQQNRYYAPRFRGICRIICPGANLRPEEAWMIDRFNMAIGAIIASNPGYSWNWDASSLKGLSTGISVREYELNGNVYTEIGKLIPMNMVHDGSFRPMRRRLSRENRPNIVQGYVSPFASATPPPVVQNQQAVPAQSTDSTFVPEQTSAMQSFAPRADVPLMPAVPELPSRYTDDEDIPF